MKSLPRISVGLLVWTCACLLQATYGASIVYVKRESTLLLPCQVPVTFTGGVVQWKKDGYPVALDNRKSIVNDTLSVASFSPSVDAGTYTCTVSNSTSALLAQPLIIRSEASQSVVFAETSLTAVVGDSVRLVCPVSRWIPRPVVQWFKSGFLLMDDLRFAKLPGGALHLTNVTPADAGNYSCVASIVNSTTRDSQNNVTLHVVHGARQFRTLASPPDKLTVLAGDTFVLPCFVNSVNDERAEWHIFGRPYRTWDKIRDPRTHIIENQYLARSTLIGDVVLDSKTREPQALLYRCNIYNASVVIQSYTTAVVVQSPPVVTNPDNPKKVEEYRIYAGLTARLNCLSHGSPSKLFWFKNAQSVKICHNRQVFADNTLNINYVSLSDSGIYQCLFKNEYGNAIYTYNLKVVMKDGGPNKPQNVSVAMVGPSLSILQVRWVACSKPRPNEYVGFSVGFVQETCEMTNQVLPKVVLYKNNCTQCNVVGKDGRLCDCCKAQFEEQELSLTRNISYLVTVAGYNAVSGSIPSDPLLFRNTANRVFSELSSPVPSLGSVAITDKSTYAAATTSTTPDGFVPQSFVVHVLDLGDALLVLWSPVQRAEGYLLHIGFAITNNDQLSEPFTVEVPAERNFTLVREDFTNATLLIEVQTKPPISLTSGEITWHPSTSRPEVRVSSMAAIAEAGSLMVFWQLSTQGDPTAKPLVDRIYLWYDCDKEERLVILYGNVTTATIEHVERYCYVVVAPVIGFEAGLSNSTRYDRWCTDVEPPSDVEIHGTEIDSDDNFAQIEVTWRGSPLVTPCEVLYSVQWRRADQPYFADGDQISVINDFSVSVPNLEKDVTYTIQVSADTTVSEQIFRSPAVNYTVGPPWEALHLRVDQAHFPASVDIEWDPPAGGHHVAVYVISLYKRQNEEWIWIKSKSEESLTKTNFSDLEWNSLYNVSVKTINRHGFGREHSIVFQGLPACTIPPCASAQAPARNLPDNTVGIIVGVCIAIGFMITSVSLGFVMAKRYKLNHTVAHVRSRTEGFNGLSDLILDPSQSDIHIQIDPVHLSLLGHIHATESGTLELDTLPSLGSPVHASHKATSAQDSGIADDHRSSQDLGEYEMAELIESNLSLDASSSGSPARWSRESGNPTIRNLLNSSLTLLSDKGDSLIDKCSHSSCTETDSLLCESNLHYHIVSDENNMQLDRKNLFVS